jgi:type I restriction enzyme, S subunit
MSRIDDLIRELCPQGVSKVPLWRLTTWDKRFRDIPTDWQPSINPHHYYLASELVGLDSSSGDVRVLTTYPSDLWTSEGAEDLKIQKGEIIAIPWGGNAVVQYFSGKYITADNRIAIARQDSVNMKFLYYYLRSRVTELDGMYRGSGIRHPSMKKVLGLLVPLPPMAVQEEIVRILDSFDSLVTDLSVGLPAEIAARRQQYEYYRDRLLSFEELAA